MEKLITPEMRNFWESKMLKGVSLRSVENSCRQLEKNLKINKLLFVCSILGPVLLTMFSGFLWVHFYKDNPMIPLLKTAVVFWIIACVLSMNMIDRRTKLNTALEAQQTILTQFNEAVYSLDPLSENEDTRFRDEKAVSALLVQFACNVLVSEFRFNKICEKAKPDPYEVTELADHLKESRKAFNALHNSAEQFGISLDKTSYFKSASQLIGDLL